ncbi:Helicase, SNF2/RAD54 family @ intein-containing, partial [uncultured Microcoleus sp.]
ESSSRTSSQRRRKLAHRTRYRPASQFTNSRSQCYYRNGGRI